MPRKAAQPLMLVADFARLSAKKLDWQSAIERAHNWHVRTGMWLGLELARQHLAAAVAPEHLEQLQPARARKNWLLNSLSGERLWSTEKHRQARYTFHFKLKCLDTKLDEARAICALSKGVFRKLGLSRTWSQKELRPKPGA
jgi:hypothetical protein